MAYENPFEFNGELESFLATGEPLDKWHLLEARYPELLADWLTTNREYEPPAEIGVRIGKRPDHIKGGRHNYGKTI